MVNSSEDEASVGSSKSGQVLTLQSSPTTPYVTATQADEPEAPTISLLLESTLAVLFC